MQKKSEKLNNKIRVKPDLSKQAAWSGYQQTYIQNIVKGGLKALKLLAAITFDPLLYLYIKPLETHLQKRMEEAEKEKEEVKKYTW